VLDAAADELGVDTATLLGDTSRLVHGTTITTNAIIEDETARTGLITTDGFTETLWLREGGKDNPYDWDIDYPDPYIPLELTHGVTERINSEGGVETSLDEDEVVAAIERLQAQDVDAVAVSLLWAHVNPTHEQQIGDLLDEHAPDLHYSLSHETIPIIREYRRTSSTAIDASVHGPMEDYLSTLQAKLSDRGFAGEPLIVTSNGGVMQIEEVISDPIWTVDSGPTMFPVSSLEHVSTELGAENVLALDMGGTSLDMSVVEDGVIARTREAEIADDVLGIEKVDVKSIGSGGGSIARVDEGGFLHVGPESAGAQPGPACYLRGGTDPTVTDAALKLGYLNEEYFLGGDMDIGTDAATEALERIADPLGLSVEKAAWSVHRTAIQNMVNGIQGVTVERGIDPRNFVMSGGGGALGMHVVPLARELQIDDILLPREAGVVSAVGSVYSNIHRDFSGSELTESDRFDHETVNETLADLQDQAEAFLDRIEVPEADRSVAFYAEARYPQQAWELQVSLPAPRVTPENIADVVDRFHAVHADTFGFRMDEQPVEFLYWRVEATGETGGAIPAGTAETGDMDEAKHGERAAYFDGEQHAAPAYRSTGLRPGHDLAGPAFVDDENTTIVLYPESTLSVTDRGNFHIRP